MTRLAKDRPELPDDDASGSPARQSLFRKILWKLGAGRRRRAEHEALKWNVKVMGYEMARRMALRLGHADAPTAAGDVGLTSKGCTQSDIESAWFSYWSHRLEATPVYHRKLWEFCYILQALHEFRALVPNAAGLGFGCGEEPLPSLLASMGISVLATDAPREVAKGAHWSQTGQHTRSLDVLYKAELCDRRAFDHRVTLRHVDMNSIPPDLAGRFDFLWSACALEHLGSIANGLAFIEKSLDCLKPGGVAVHTTEWNYASDSATIDNWDTVLFQRRHFEALGETLSAKGYEVSPFDFGVGREFLDRFVDVPPYASGLPAGLQGASNESQAHLRLLVEGFACTSFGIILRAPG